MRDIFTMGARPIANLNCLRFGSMKDDKTNHLFKGVVLVLVIMEIVLVFLLLLVNVVLTQDIIKIF